MDKLSGGTVVSTRIRLARNLEGYPFPSHLQGEKQAKEIIRLVSSG
ncbi:MAG TPA: ATP--guanido phosphotransferase, partial [Clostridiales bacterium]|nr:ATP--guanido phosphotransferase [Clostridiales bacterium]